MRQRIKKRPISDINVVPYIDVMLVLLVIFMITAPLLNQGVKVDLPQAPSAPLPPNDKEPVIVSIDKKGNIYINYGDDKESPVVADVLVTRVKALLQYQPGIPVLVGGDADVSYGQIIKVMTLLQQAGVVSVGMMTDPVEQ